MTFGALTLTGYALSGPCTFFDLRAWTLEPWTFGALDLEAMDLGDLAGIKW